MRNNFWVLFISILLIQCQNINEITPVVTQKSSETLISANPTQTKEIQKTGCILPPTLISDKNIRYFNWSENGESIIYKELDNEIWYRYNINSSQTDVVTEAHFQTPVPQYTELNVVNFNEIFVSPNEEIILFTRGTSPKYDVYYKKKSNSQEKYLGKIIGEIETIDWFKKEEKAIIAMDWQSPSGIREAHVYTVDFSSNTIEVEIPQSSNYRNLHYIDLTPDETRIMFVEYNGNPIVKMWDISTNNITLTPVFNPMNPKWLSENEFVSVGYQIPDSFPRISVVIYNVNNDDLIFLAKESFRIQPFISNGLLSPSGSAIGYIEDETNYLYWTICKQ